MRIKVDELKCCGFGNCVAVAPQVFVLGGQDNLARPVVEDTDPSLRERAERAMRDCPAQAIKIE
jgi:ferredoxin